MSLTSYPAAHASYSASLGRREMGTVLVGVAIHVASIAMSIWMVEASVVGNEVIIGRICSADALAVIGATRLRVRGGGNLLFVIVALRIVLAGVAAVAVILVAIIAIFATGVAVGVAVAIFRGGARVGVTLVKPGQNAPGVVNQVLARGNSCLRVRLLTGGGEARQRQIKVVPLPIGRQRHSGGGESTTRPKEKKRKNTSWHTRSCAGLDL